MASPPRPRTALLLLLLVVMLAALASLASGPRAAEAFVNPRYRPQDLGRVLTPQECAILIREATPHFARSTVVADQSRRQSPVSRVRTSHTAWLRDDDGHSPEARAVVRKVRALAAKVTGVADPARYEDLQVVRYAPGQEYKAHFDSAIELAGSPAETVERYATLIVYLNEGFGGGETSFPKLDLKIKPRTGMGALFYNLNDDNTEHAMSLHESLPVSAGVKYACQQWIRA